MQDVLFEDVAFNDELEQWCQQRCAVFDLDDDAEHKLEWTDLHEEFCKLFEDRIESFLRRENHSVEEFWQKLTKAADGDEEYFGEAFLLQCLAATIDYNAFVITMRGLRRNTLGK